VKTNGAIETFGLGSDAAMRGTNSDEKEQFIKLDISNETYMT
jgi:hypothetical protein